MSTATAEPTIQQTQVVSIPAEGQVSVPLDQVDDTMFPNYRKNVDEDHINQLSKEIKEHGQLTPCGGSWSKDGSKIGIWSGFCRLEAMRRLATEKVVKEYNEAMGKKSGDDGYIPPGGLGFDNHKLREQIRQVGGEWAAKYEAALKAYKIDFKTIPVEDDVDAALKGISANTMDKPPLMDLCQRIDDLCNTEINGAKVTAKRIAGALKMTEAQISHHRKIYATANYLRETLVGTTEKPVDLTALGLKPEEAEAERQSLATAIGEWERRLRLRKDNPQAISFSHAREFSNAVQNKQEPMTLAGIARLLRFLVSLSSTGKPSTDATPDWTVFNNRLRDFRKLGKAAEEPAPAAGATAAPAAAAPAAAAGVDTSTLSADQKAQFAAAGAAAAVATAPAQSAAQPPATTAPVVAQCPALSAEDQAKMAEVNAANDVPVNTLDDLVKPAETTDELLAGTPAAATTPPPAGQPAGPTDGQMKSKTVEGGPESVYKVKPPEKIESLANRMLDHLDNTDPEANATFIDQLGYLLSSVQLFGVIGMDDPVNILQEIYVNQSEAANSYIAKLEATVKECKGDEFLADVRKLRPQFTRPKLTK